MKANDWLRGMNARITYQMNVPTSSATNEPSIDPMQENVEAGDRNVAQASSPESCPACSGMGFVLSDVPLGHPDFGKAIPCHCKVNERQVRQMSRFQRMSDLNALARFTFKAFTPEPPHLPPYTLESLRLAYKVALKFAEQPRGWLLFSGGYGCGKTHLAAAITNQRLDQGQAAIFVVVPDLLDHLRMTYGPDSEVRYDELFNEVRNTSLLVLDDLGVQNATPWVQEKLFQILNHRYNSRLPTVLTTNQRLEDLDQRLCSRLRDMDLVKRLHITAPDYRLGNNPSKGNLSTLALHEHQRFETFDVRRRNASAEVQSTLRRVKEAATAYAHDPYGWFVLRGPNGVGKTHLAAAISNEFATVLLNTSLDEVGKTHLAAVISNAQTKFDVMFDVMFVVVPDFLDYLRAAFNPQSPVPYDRRFDELKNSRLLVLDDLGTESATPWAKEKLFQLLNYRYNAVLPTIITTSATDEKIDPWLRTRMADTICQVWTIKAGSYRGSADQGAVARTARQQGNARHKSSW